MENLLDFYVNLMIVEEKVGKPHGSTEIVEDVTETIAQPLS